MKPIISNEIFRQLEELTFEDLQFKTNSELFYKLVEEVGELAQAMQVEGKVFRNEHKTITEPARMEALDAVIAAFAMYYASGGKTEDIETSISSKLAKWNS